MEPRRRSPESLHRSKECQELQQRTSFDFSTCVSITGEGGILQISIGTAKVDGAKTMNPLREENVVFMCTDFRSSLGNPNAFVYPNHIQQHPD